MSIFEDLDGLAIFEEHIATLLNLEEAQAKSILKIYRRVSHTLRARLRAVRENTFTEQQIRVALAQIDSGIVVLTADLERAIPGSINALAEAGVSHLVDEAIIMEKVFGGSLQKVNLDAVKIAANTKNFLFNRYAKSVATYSQSLRSNMAMGLADMIAENVGWDMMVRRMMTYFESEEWRLRRIVRTELHHVYGQAKLTGMRDIRGGMFPDLKKSLYHPLDSRTAKDSEYAETLKLVVGLDEPFRYQWKGKWRTFMAPPDRPNDRSILIPFRQSWGEVGEDK